MSTIAIAQLKAHLSAEIKKVKAGETLVILDHKQAVARLVPLESEVKLSRRASRTPCFVDYSPLLATEPLLALTEERAD